MRRRRLLTLSVTLPALAGALVALVGALSGAASATAKPTVALSHSVSAMAARTQRVGSVAGTTQINFEVVLRLPDQQGAAAFAQSVSTPGSASYRQFLTPVQWEARFSPSVHDVSAVRAFLHLSGFAVGAVSGDRMAVSASGSAGQVERAFATSLSYHRVAGSRLLLADRNLSVPANLAGVVAGVTGVSQTLAHPASRIPASRHAPSRHAPSRHAPIPQPAGFLIAPPCGTYYGRKIDTSLPAFGHGYPANPPWAGCGYTGPQFRSAYGLNGPADGTGVTVAVIDAYASPTLFSDAHRFAATTDPGHPVRRSRFFELLPHSFNQIKLCQASGWFGEQTLDVEAVHDTAPGANIVYAGARNCSTQGLNDALRAVIDHHLADVVTNSYGDNGGDVLDGAGDRYATDNILMMAAATGVSVLFSSGDAGDQYSTAGSVLADYPASSPWATAVGGTTLQVGSAGQRLGEYGWSTVRSHYCNPAYVAAKGCTRKQLGTWSPIDKVLLGGSGGGTSFAYRQPFYQQGIVPAALSQRNAGILGPVPMRVEPDISMDADSATGILMGETQTFPNGVRYALTRYGGTSLSSPLLAGVVARADQAGGAPAGFLNPKLYSLSGNPNAIYDVLPTAAQSLSRADYPNPVKRSRGVLYTTRVIDYEGQERFCNPLTKQCTTRTVALNTAPGFDSMTGLGAPTGGFVGALAAASK